MDRRRVSVRVGQVCLLLVVAGLLLYWWEKKPPVVVSDDEVDDLIEEVGDTYVPVHVANIEQGTLRQYVTAYGAVAPASAMDGREAASAKVSSPLMAIVSSVNCVEGQHVETGQVLFTLDSRAADAEIAQAERLVQADEAGIAEIGKAGAATQAAATQPATQSLGMAYAQRQLAADEAMLARAKASGKLLTATAPITGTVISLSVGAGETAEAAKTAVELVDLDRLVASVDVTAADLASLRVGQDATVELRSGEFRSGEFRSGNATQPADASGKVVLVDSAINPATGMGSVDVAISEGSGMLPGEFVKARIVVGEESDRLMVPTESITQNANGDPAVGMVQTDGRWAVLVPVKTGWRDGDKTEIEGEGLAAGQPVVTEGANGLVQRTRLHLVRD
jgi:RND family efflux transporter MFP subunit